MMAKLEHFYTSYLQISHSVHWLRCFRRPMVATLQPTSTLLFLIVVNDASSVGSLTWTFFFFFSLFFVTEWSWTNHMAVTQCVQAYIHGQYDLLKFILSIRMKTKGHLSDFEWGMLLLTNRLVWIFQKLGCIEIFKHKHPTQVLI